MPCCKLLGSVLLLGAAALGTVAYSHYTGCCVFTGEPLNGKAKCCDQQPVSPADAGNFPVAGVMKKGGKAYQPPATQETKAFWTSLAGKSGQDDGCCSGGCCGSCDGQDSKKTETAAKK